MTTLAHQLSAAAVAYLREGVKRIGLCLDRLSQQEIWHDHNGNLVSVGNLILHLEGNVSQYIIQGLGGRDYERHRDDEFVAKPDLSAEMLLERIAGTIERAVEVIEGLDEERLRRPARIQGFDHTGTSALVHVVEHFSYHVGQITFAVKYLKDVDLGYYAGSDLNAG